MPKQDSSPYLTKLKLYLGVTGVFAIMITLAYLTVGLLPSTAQAANDSIAIDPSVLSWGYIAAALATGLSVLGAGHAVASVGAAAIGGIAEKPELFGRALILVGLAEGLAIYGLIISIMILNRLV